MTSKIFKSVWLRHFGIAFGILLAVSISGCQPQNTTSAGQSKSNIALVSDDEPGEPMIVSGTVFGPDGKTPVQGISVYVYQTDAAGKYNWLGLGRPLGMPRIKGTMITDSQGGYEYRSVKPGPYPNKRIKPHVHYRVKGGNYPEQKFKLSIVDDAPEDPSGFNDHCRLKISNKGISRCTLNLRLVSDPLSASSQP